MFKIIESLEMVSNALPGVMATTMYCVTLKSTEAKKVVVTLLSMSSVIAEVVGGNMRCELVAPRIVIVR